MRVTDDASTTYNVTLISPDNYKYGYLLTDICRFMAYGLRSLGYRCDLTLNSIDTNRINIIVGSHLVTPAEADAIVRAGVRYVVFQSEWLFPGKAPGQVVSSFRGERFAAESLPLLKGTQAVWEPYDWNIGLLKGAGIPPERVKRYRAIGYHELMRDVRHRPWRAKDIDVLFFGSLTERRQRVLDALARRYRVTSLLDAPAEFRNDLIARARVNLNLNAADHYTHLSLSRVGYLLNNACAVVSEAATTHHEIQALMRCAPYERLVEACQEQLGRPDLEEQAERSYGRFKVFPVAEELRRVL